MKNEEHAFQTIQKQLKAGTLKGAMVFFGREQYLIDWAIGAILKKYINPATAEAIAQKCPNVVGIKYSWPDFTKLQQFMLVRNETFSVLVGPDHLFEALCAVGGEGVVSGNAMCIPEHYAKVWEAVQAKDYDLATKYQRRTNVLNATMCAINNIAAYKVILKNEGVIATTKMRRPMENLTPEQEKELLATMEKLKYREVLI